MDREGNIWFTSIEGGIKYDGRSFSKFAYQNRANLDCFSITPDKYGNLWVMTLDGPAVQNQDNAFKMIKFPGTLGYGGVFHGDQKGNMWLAYNEIGLIKYDMARVEALLAGNQVPPQDLMDLKKDKAGQYIKSLTYFSTAQGLVDKEVKCITDDQAGNLWIGTTNGLSCFDGASFTNFTKSQGLADNDILSILTDSDGNIWFATAGGLNMLSKEASKRFLDNKQAKNNASKEIFLSFSPFGEPFSSYIASIVQLPDGRIAFATESGLTVFNLSKDLTTPQNISFYGEKTGYPIKNANRLFFDKMGILWITTQDGDNPLIRFDINAIQKNTKPPTVLIQSLSVNDKNISWNSLHKASPMAKKDSLTTPASTLEETSVYGKVLTGQERDSLRNKFGGIQFNGITPFYPLPKKLKLPYQYNSVSFKFIASELGQNSLVRYSYMLEGYSKEWSNETDNTTATFGNISEGNYTFKLKAKTPGGTWSEPVTYTFTVLPPWWRTWWAYTIFALTFLFALRFFVKWRERNLRIEKEKLERTVEIRTAEVVAEKKEVEKQKQEADRQRDEANKQRERSDELLLNILPEEVAEELKAKGSADAKQFDQVTVMFTDFKGFTQISEKLTPSELVAEIHTCFKAFDNIITKYNIEKIKTIGDAYMCAGGLPVTNTNHPVDVVHAALEIQQFMQAHLAQRKMEHKELFEMRIGIHTGPVVAGIVGVKKFAYDIWGDTVNTASRMESSGEAGKINISGSTYALVKDQFNCIHRGKIQAKNMGEIDMYFVEGKE
jgi:class 3 adenylate cyclase